MPDQPEVLATGTGGWVRYEAAGLDPSVFVRFEERGGRLSAIELYLPSEGRLDTGLLRRVPLGRIEAWVNEPKVAKGLRKDLTRPGPDLRRAASYFEGPQRGDHWIARMFASQSPASDEPVPPMRPLGAFPKLPPTASKDEPPVDARLDVPAGTRDYGDAFYRQVAEVYTALVHRGESPGAALADANHVVPTKAHRWIREARRRRFLPPGVRGKAG